jgi:rod shape-determining protein MreC
VGLINAKRLFFLIVLLTVTLAAMRYTISGQAWLTPLGSKFRDAFAPVQSGLTWASRQVQHIVSKPVALYRAAERNKALERQVEQLQSEIVVLNECKAENQRLTELLNYKQVMAQRYDLLVASVIARDPDNWFATVTLNRGSREGVRENMAVLTHQVLVGRVINATEECCEVLLITDPRSGVGALIQEIRTPGIVEGNVGSTGTARIIHIPNDAQVAEGQVVVTSGNGSIYPKGIPIGRIVSVSDESAGLFKRADIQLFAKMYQLEEVFIVTRVHPEAAGSPTVGG